METKEFSSPVRKLVAFFRSSRDKWKRKCQKSKQTCKILSNQVRAVENSRARWKEKAKAEAERATRLEQELEALKSVV